MKNILPKIRGEKQKLLKLYWLPTTTKEERTKMENRYKRLANIENKIIKKYF